MPIEAFLLGVSTGSYCILSCAPLSLPFLFAETNGPRRNAVMVGLFMAGRLIGYLLVGLILGWAGYAVLKYVDPGLERALSIIAYGIAGAILLIQGLSYTTKFKRLCAMAKIKSFGRNALILGLVSGMSLCPPFLSAASRVLGASAKGNPSEILNAVLYFLFFFLGTSLFFLPLLGVPLLKKFQDKLAAIARLTMLLMGGYFLFFLCVLELLKDGLKNV